MIGREQTGRLFGREKTKIGGVSFHQTMREVQQRGIDELRRREILQNHRREGAGIRNRSVKLEFALLLGVVDELRCVNRRVATGSVSGGFYI